MNRTLGIGTVLSLILLVAAVTIQFNWPDILDLPTQWLAVSALPVIIALFVGGYIKKFKGFGVELEAALRAPVATLGLTAGEVLADLPTESKASTAFLHSLPPAKANRVRRLRFKLGNQYDSYAIREYLALLPELELFEVVSGDGSIEGLLHVQEFLLADRRSSERFNTTRIDDFIRSVEGGSLSPAFTNDVITLKVQSDVSLVEVLRQLRTESVEMAAVVSPAGKYLGVVQVRDVERHVADSVLRVRAA